MVSCSPRTVSAPLAATTASLRSSSLLTCCSRTIERFFRSLKEECVWQHNFASFVEAKAVIASWIRFYNERRPHQALDYLSPHQYQAQQLQAVA